MEKYQEISILLEIHLCIYLMDVNVDDGSMVVLNREPEDRNKLKVGHTRLNV